VIKKITTTIKTYGYSEIMGKIKSLIKNITLVLLEKEPKVKAPLFSFLEKKKQKIWTPLVLRTYILLRRNLLS